MSTEVPPQSKPRVKQVQSRYLQGARTRAKSESRRLSISSACSDSSCSSQASKDSVTSAQSLNTTLKSFSPKRHGKENLSHQPISPRTSSVSLSSAVLSQHNLSTSLHSKTKSPTAPATPCSSSTTSPPSATQSPSPSPSPTTPQPPPTHQQQDPSTPSRSRLYPAKPVTAEDDAAHYNHLMQRMFVRAREQHMFDEEKTRAEKLMLGLFREIQEQRTQLLELEVQLQRQQRLKQLETVLNVEETQLLQHLNELERFSEQHSELVGFLSQAAHSMPTQHIVCDQDKLAVALAESEELLRPIAASLAEFAEPICEYANALTCLSDVVESGAMRGQHTSSLLRATMEMQMQDLSLKVHAAQSPHDFAGC
eukprot:c3554_g1_i1.p1 GENE.c3554_g1_i1~~c3554_g1_i1.p1  ORF type:complete len:388 (-),score=74.32 c3554_g1_i1:280-1380(-)